jgi:hypothetical protein
MRDSKEQGQPLRVHHVRRVADDGTHKEANLVTMCELLPFGGAQSGMTTTLAIWGAVTGTLGLGIALFQVWREYSKRLIVMPVVNLGLSRDERRWLIKASMGVALRNDGKRTVGVQHLGLMTVDGRRIEFIGGPPLEVAPDQPLRSFYVPMGEVVALWDDVDPFETPISVWARTSEGMWVVGMPQPMIPAPPPWIDIEYVRRRVRELAAEPRSEQGRMIEFDYEAWVLNTYDPDTTAEIAAALIEELERRGEADDAAFRA